MVGFNYARTLAKESADVGIHFFLDDYQFERVWRQPEAYTETLRRFSCVLTPDFSTYSDMPMPMQMWNVYRSRAVGRYWQDQGLTVIPTLQWAEPSSYAYCLTGLPEGATVAVSTVGVRKDPMAVALWRRGMEQALEWVHPERVLHYGPRIPDFDFGTTEVVEYQNQVTSRLEARRGRTRK